MSPTPEAESPAFAIVHQSAVACAQIARVLRDLGYGVVATGSDVADVLVSGANAVIVDGRMERLAGRIAELRAAKPDAKILVLASLEEIALVRTAVAAGAHGAIRRPPLRSRMEEALAAAFSRE